MELEPAPAGGTPEVHRRRVREALRSARRQRELTQETVAARLNWSKSKVARIESGQVGVSVTDLRALLALYQVSDPDQVTRLEAGTREGRRRTSSWRRYADVLSPAFVTYLGYEESATRIRHFQPAIVPGLAQTPAYARAVLGAAASGEELTRRLALRTERQHRVLGRPDSPRLHLVLDEAVLRRRVGGPGVLAEQLRYLTELSVSPRVTLQVIGFDAGYYPGISAPFVLLDADDIRVLYQEGSRGDLLLRDNPTEITAHTTMFDNLEQRARSVEHSCATVQEILGDPQCRPGTQRPVR